MNTLVTLNNGQAITTSLAIANGTENEHASVIRLVRTYQNDLEEFGRVGFEIRPFETTGGIQQREVATLNEQQSTLLLTYMRNSEIVRRFKKALVKAFFELTQRPQHLIPQSLPEALRLAADLADQKAKAEAQLAIAAPKAEALDRISASEGTLTLTQAAKVLGVKFSTMTARLHAAGWVYRQNDSWVAYETQIKSGRLQYKEARYTDQNTGQECRRPYCHVTPKGMVKLAMMFGSFLPEEYCQPRASA